LWLAAQEHLQNKRNSANLTPLHGRRPAMIDLREVQAELSHARQVRLATEAAGCEMEALVLDMQNHAWHRVALADLIDASYDPHLFKRPN
jgi:hypothetical protein